MQALELPFTENLYNIKTSGDFKAVIVLLCGCFQGVKKAMADSIEYAQFGFRLNENEPLVLPAYKGSTLRGGFGHAFKRVICAVKNKECPDCLLKEKCIYSYVFETPPPSDTKIMRKYISAQSGFIG
jgi:hypothetical protein